MLFGEKYAFPMEMYTVVDLTKFVNTMLEIKDFALFGRYVIYLCRLNYDFYVLIVPYYHIFISSIDLICAMLKRLVCVLAMLCLCYTFCAMPVLMI